MRKLIDRLFERMGYRRKMTPIKLFDLSDGFPKEIYVRRLIDPTWDLSKISSLEQEMVGELIPKLTNYVVFEQHNTPSDIFREYRAAITIFRPTVDSNIK